MESAKASACQNLIQASTWMPVRRGWKRQKDAKAAKPDSSIQPLHTNTLQYLFVQSISINPKVSWMATTGWLTPGLLVKGGVHLMGNGQLVISWYTIQSHWKPPRNNQRFTCHGVVPISWCSSGCCDFAAIWQVDWWRLAMSSCRGGACILQTLAARRHSSLLSLSAHSPKKKWVKIRSQRTDFQKKCYLSKSTFFKDVGDLWLPTR